MEKKPIDISTSPWRHDVVIDIIYINDVPDDYLVGVWADKKSARIIGNTEGVSHIVSQQGNFFIVQLDRRYDPSWSIEEIIANIKIGNNDG